MSCLCVQLLSCYVLNDFIRHSCMMASLHTERVPYACRSVVKLFLDSPMWGDLAQQVYSSLCAGFTPAR